MVISDSTFYWKEKVFNLSNTSEIKKDHDFFTHEDIVICDGIAQGPQKLNNPDFIMYVTKNFRVEYEPDALDSDADDDSENISKEKKTIVRGEEEEK